MLLKRIIQTNYKKSPDSTKKNTMDSIIENKPKYSRVFRKSNFKKNRSNSSPIEIKIRNNQLNKDEIFNLDIFSTMLNKSNKIFNDNRLDFLNINLDKEQNQKRFKIINEIKLFLLANKINFLLCDIIYLFDILLLKSKKYDDASNMFNYQNLGLGSLILANKFYNINENNTNINYKKYKSLYDEKYFSLNEFKYIELNSLKLLNYNLTFPSLSSYMKFILSSFYSYNKSGLKFVEKILKEIMITSNDYMKYHPFYLASFVVNYYFDKMEVKDYFNKIIYYFEFDISKYKILYQKFINSNSHIIDNIYWNKKYSTINLEKSKNLIEKNRNTINETITNQNKNIKNYSNSNENILYKPKKVSTISTKVKDDNINQDYESRDTSKNAVKNHLLLKIYNQKLIHNNTQNDSSNVKLKKILFNKKKKKNPYDNNNETDYKNSINNSSSTNNNDNIKISYLNLKKQKSFYLPNFPNINYYMRQRAKYDNKNINKIPSLIEKKISKIKKENTKTEEKSSFSNYFVLSKSKLNKEEEKTEDKNKKDYTKSKINDSHKTNSIRKIYLRSYINKNLVCKNLFTNDDKLRKKMKIDNHILINSSDNLGQYPFNSPDEKKNNIRKYYKSKKKDDNNNRYNS